MTGIEMRWQPGWLSSEWIAEQTVDGRWIGDEAQELLGLTEHEADDLFYSRNTLDRIREVIEQIKERAEAMEAPR